MKSIFLMFLNLISIGYVYRMCDQQYFNTISKYWGKNIKACLLENHLELKYKGECLRFCKLLLILVMYMEFSVLNIYSLPY